VKKMANPSLMVHDPVRTAMPVAEALSRLIMSNNLKDYIVDKREYWATFGKMNSHLYRAMLMKRMAEANLNGECKFMIFFLFSVIKNKDRVLRELDAMPAEDQQLAWFNPTKNFISTHITQYVSDVVRSKKFPAVNIPNCNPGLDILVYCMITHPNERSINDVVVRPTFSQLALNQDFQQDARLGYAQYWNDIVRGSRNPDAKGLEEPEFREDYYENVRSDRYFLVGLDLKEIPPRDLAAGYNHMEVINYMISIDLKNEYDSGSSVLQKEIDVLMSPPQSVNG
jgi:hypothetical protein